MRAFEETTAPTLPLTVFVAKPVGVSYGEAMSRLRMWLDSQKVQPTQFKLAPLGGVGFEIGFRSDEDVARFQGGFGWDGSGGAEIG